MIFFLLHNFFFLMPVEIKESKADIFCVAEANISGGI